MFLLAAAITVATDFDGGSTGAVERVSETHLRIAAKGQKDQDGRNRQANWYYFRVDHAKPGAELRLDLVDLPGEYNYKPNRGAVTADTPAVISYDGKSWKHVPAFEYDPGEPKMILRVRPEKSTFWIAHTPPYTSRDLEALRSAAGKHAEFRETIAGKSVEGRPVYLWTIGSGPKTVWLMFRQHSWESGSSWSGDGAVRYLLSEKGAPLRAAITWKIFPLCDPDGVAHGGVRFNVNGYDLNRNWDVEDPVKMPEIDAQRRAIRAWISAGHKIDLFLTLHNTETAEYLEGPPAGHGELSAALFAALKSESLFAPTRPLSSSEVTTTAGMKGRMNVAQGLHHDFGIASFTIEQRISMNPRLGRLPEIGDREEFGAGLVRAIGKSVGLQPPR